MLLFGSPYGMSRDLLKSRASEALDRVGLRDRKEASLAFSGGMKRRFNITCALVAGLRRPETGQRPPDARPVPAALEFWTWFERLFWVSASCACSCAAV
jgi:hypothetical protein